MNELNNYGVYNKIYGGTYLAATPGKKAVEYALTKCFNDYINNQYYMRGLMFKSKIFHEYDVLDEEYLKLVFNDVDYYTSLNLLPIQENTKDLGLKSIIFEFNGENLLKIIFNCTTEFLMYREVIAQISLDTRYFESDDYLWFIPESFIKVRNDIFKFVNNTGIQVITCLNIYDVYKSHKYKNNINDVNIYLLNECHFDISMAKYKNINFIHESPILNVNRIKHYVSKGVYIDKVLSNILFLVNYFNYCSDIEDFIAEFRYRDANKVHKFFYQYINNKFIDVHRFYMLFKRLEKLFNFKNYNRIYFYKDKVNKSESYSSLEVLSWDEVIEFINFYEKYADEFGFKIMKS